MLACRLYLIHIIELVLFLTMNEIFVAVH